MGSRLSNLHGMSVLADSGHDRDIVLRAVLTRTRLVLLDQLVDAELTYCLLTLNALSLDYWNVIAFYALCSVDCGLEKLIFCVVRDEFDKVVVSHFLVLETFLRHD